MKKSISTVIEITDTHVKLLQATMVRGQRAAKGDLRRVISTCEVRPISEPGNDHIPKRLKEMIRSKTIRPEQLLLVIPRRFTILKRMRLPSHNEAEMRKIIELQLITQIPYPLEDVVFDYHILEKESSGYTCVLVIIVQKEVSRRYLKMLHEVGITPAKLTLSSLGLLGWLNYQQEKINITSNEAVVLINMDQAYSEICFCHDWRLLFSRSIHYGLTDIKTDDLSEFIKQLHLSLEAYEKEKMGPSVKKIFILFPSAETAILKEKVAKATELPIFTFSSLENIPCQGNGRLSTFQGQDGLSLGVGLGLLLSDQKEWLNLIPQEVHDFQKAKFRKRQLVTSYLLLTLIVGLGVSILQMEIYQKNLYLQALEKQIESIKPQLDEAGETSQFVQFFNNEFQKRIFIVDVVDQLYDLTPPGISFRSLSVDEDGRLTMEGYAETSAGVNDFQTRLVESSAFREVNLQFATKRKISNQDVTDFKIHSQLFQGKQK